MQKEVRKISRINKIRRRYPKGEIPEIYNKGFIKLAIKLLPKLEKRIKVFDKYIREERIWGDTAVLNDEKITKLKIESKDGIIKEIYVNTIHKDGDDIIGYTNRSVIYDSVRFNIDEKETNNNSKKEA
jgi:hypothetical protein